MDPAIHLILSYCKSHIYELHSLLAAIPTFFIVQWVKQPLKNYSEKKYGNIEKKRHTFNAIIILLALIVGALCYCVVAVISPLVEIKWLTVLTTGTITVTTYEILEKTGLIKYFTREEEI